MISSRTFRNLEKAWRRKIRPMTGMKYSLLAKFELARSWSPEPQRRFSMLVIWSKHRGIAFEDLR
jgi:hypothetical protein